MDNRSLREIKDFEEKVYQESQESIDHDFKILDIECQINKAKHIANLLRFLLVGIGIILGMYIAFELAWYTYGKLLK